MAEGQVILTAAHFQIPLHATSVVSEVVYEQSLSLSDLCYASANIKPCFAEPWTMFPIATRHFLFLPNKS